MTSTKKHIERQINRELKLGASGNEQDWDIELADSRRINEFLSYYHTCERNYERDFALMSLIAASFDELLSIRIGKEPIDYFSVKDNDIERIYTIDERIIWDSIFSLLRENPRIFLEIVSYWSMIDDDGNPFASTPLFRMALKSLRDASEGLSE